ncbi:MAG: HEAT repeat domain-containing protein, partial [Gemmatimonadota bacterium]
MPIIRVMHATRWSPRGPILPALLLLLACNAPGGGAPSRFGAEADLWRRMLAAEDGRVASPAALGALRQGVRSADPELRRQAVRAFGRFEQDSLVPDLVPTLADLSAEVRAEAANALGQAVSGGDPAAARAALIERLDTETDPAVRAVIAETLGRLRQASADRVAATGTLLAGLVEAAPETWLGIAKGFYFLVRQRVARGALPAGVIGRIRDLTVYMVPGADSAVSGTAARVRRLATASLVSAGAITAADIDALLADADPFVRREAAAGIGGLADRAAAARLAERALADQSPAPRIEAVRALPRVASSARACPALLRAMRDGNAHVALLAIDAAGTASCRNAVARLDSLVGTLPPPGSGPDAGWHRAAHAMVSLARLDGSRAA